MAQIRTMRKYVNKASYDIVFEWENEIKDSLCIEWYFYRDFVIHNKHLLRKVSDVTGLNLTDWNIGKNDKVFTFEMQARPLKSGIARNNVSVCFIDFYLKEKEEIRKFLDIYANNDFIYISSKEAYDKVTNITPSKKIKHLPLTLPSKYKLTYTDFQDREFDVAILGHISPLLKEYLEKYCRSHNINCVYRCGSKQDPFLVCSSKDGKTWDVRTREDYFKLLNCTKVMLYNTSGIDESRMGNNGYHQVTPRFLEYISSGCNTISRYIENSDTDFFELKRMTKKVDDYNEFEEHMNDALHIGPDQKEYQKYLEKHYTSTILPILSEDLQIPHNT